MQKGPFGIPHCPAHLPTFWRTVWGWTDSTSTAIAVWSGGPVGCWVLQHILVWFRFPQCCCRACCDIRRVLNTCIGSSLYISGMQDCVCGQDGVSNSAEAGSCTVGFSLSWSAACSVQVLDLISTRGWRMLCRGLVASSISLIFVSSNITNMC